jgi:hypothetical protein
VLLPQLHNNGVRRNFCCESNRISCSSNLKLLLPDGLYTGSKQSSWGTADNNVS